MNTTSALPDVRNLKDFFEITLGSTYPRQTLTRRLGFLSLNEQKNLVVLWNKVERISEEMQKILDDRAAKMNDKWP